MILMFHMYRCVVFEGVKSRQILSSFYCAVLLLGISLTGGWLDSCFG